MNSRYAVIDLGTNTFHLLIAEKEAGRPMEILLQKQVFVQLGIEGVETLGAAPFERGLQTMQTFHQLLADYEVEQVRAIGTAALRTASNGPAFLDRVKEQTGIAIELITGDEEAVWIYKGVRQAVQFRPGFSLIMDIGGGSVEFMLADEKKLHWWESFPVGLAVLFRRFHRHDPIRPAESARIFAFLEEQLAPLWRQLSAFQPHTLVGAAGIFEIFRDFLPCNVISASQQDFLARDFGELRRMIVGSTYEERLMMDKLPPARADLAVVAMELIHYILERTAIQHISVSAYAMKEGVLGEMGL